MDCPPTLVALHLPQFHPIPENDEWWGKGFTEWTNVTKARPLYRGHEQPNLPADLGFYDLRLPEARAAQAALARSYGVSAFCYYHYYFGNGRRLLERPVQDIISSGEPNFPFMLCWANQSWSGVWHGLSNRTLIEQQYPGTRDHEAHFESLLPAFNDRRYLRVEGKPVFMIYSPDTLPDGFAVTAQWRAMARSAGFDGLYLMAEHDDPHWDARVFGYDAFVNQRGFQRRRSWLPWSSPVEKIKNKVLDALGRPTIRDYESMVPFIVPESASPLAIPSAMPNWDNTPRSGARGLVLTGATPEAFGRCLDRALARHRGRNSSDSFIFLKSWNEWAEGNHLEPGRQHGHRYLEVLQQRVQSHGGVKPVGVLPDLLQRPLAARW